MFQQKTTSGISERKVVKMVKPFWDRHFGAIVAIIIFLTLLFYGTKGTWNMGDFNWGYIFNFTVIPPTGYPPGYTPPPGNLPPGFSGSGSMTAAECSQYATMNGKTNSVLKTSESNCATSAANTCHNQGLEAHYDYISGCCVFNCEPIQQTACQTFCSSHNLLLIQTGFWTEQQCYDSSIYLCGGLLYLETDLVSPDGTCCCYKCK